MLGEGNGRGAILEQCLCKLMFCNHQQNKQKIQVIGMSATLGNVDELCQFLSAYNFRTNFRPVKLIERIKIQDKLYLIDQEGNWKVEMHLPKRNVSIK
jgi:replicative superfamily II helicase